MILPEDVDLLNDLPHDVLADDLTDLTDAPSHDLASLSDAAHVQIYPISPAISAVGAQRLQIRVARLFAHFERENYAGKAAVSCLENGAVLVIAYEEGLMPMSGCRRDKLGKLIQQIEEQFAVQILNAPPMLLRVAGVWQAHQRASLKPLVTAGTVDLNSEAYDLRCETLGAWRIGGIKLVKDMWLKPIIERLL